MPEDIVFATKIEIARELIAAALDAGRLVDGGWRMRFMAVIPGCAGMLEARRQPYVLAVRSNHYLRFVVQEGGVATDPETIAEDLPEEAWTTLAAGEGTKGLRLYDWARVSLPWTAGEAGRLMIRRSRKEPEKHAYYLVFAPDATTFAELAGAAGLRWTIGECFERTKDDLGLDHCEARSWHGWHRHMSLCLAAAALLAKLAAELKRAAWGKPNERVQRRQSPLDHHDRLGTDSAGDPPPPGATPHQAHQSAWPSLSPGRSGGDDTNSTPPSHTTNIALIRNCSTRRRWLPALRKESGRAA